MLGEHVTGWLELQTLGLSQPIMPKNLPDHWVRYNTWLVDS